MQASIQEDTYAVEQAWRKEFLLAVAQGKPLDENARRVFEWVTEIDPENAAALNGLGRVALVRKDYQKALGYFAQAAVSLDPRPSVNAAFVCDRNGEFDEARNWAIAALRCDPDCVDAYLALLGIAEQTDDLPAAHTAIEAGLAIDPENHELLFARACLRLKAGYFEQGWADYEHRPSRLELVEKLDELPEWRGEPLAGKTLLVMGEQGFGDQVMFSRYLEADELLLNANVIFYTRPPLARLFEHNFAVDVVTSDQELSDRHVDYWIAIGSLPHVLGGKPPAREQLLRAKPADFSRVQKMLPRNGNLRVGLAWRGNPDHTRDRYRSIPWETMAELLKAPGCDFYSLQYDDSDSCLANLAGQCFDWADFAAAIENLDVVIAVDTGIAHLAAALGKRTWILLSKLSDWRWGDGGMNAKNAWYKSAHVFQQREMGDWAPVFEAVMAELRDFAPDQRNRKLVKVTPPDATVISNCRHGAMRYFRNDKWLGRSLAEYGEWSEAEVDLFCDLVNAGDTVVEAGANVGALTVPLANIVGSYGAVWAFEPQRDAFELLSENVNRNCPHVKMRQLALGAQLGAGSYTAANFNAVCNPGGCELSESGASEVQVVTLDEFHLDRLDFLKADVEGMELEVLKGAEQTIARCRPLIYAENDRPGATEKLLAWLTAHGYRAYQHTAPLFNARNYRGSRVNIFGGTVSLMLLGVPKERYLAADVIERHKLDRVRLTRSRA